MLNEKLNLYNPEWLELVFADRNKAYGAYELRKTYGTTIAKAMAIAFSTVIIVSAGYTYAKSRRPVDKPRDFGKEIILPPPPSITPEKKIETVVEPKSAAPAKPQPAAATVKYTVPRIVPQEVDTEMPTVKELEGVEVGAVTSKGNGGQPQIVDPGPATGTGGIGNDSGVDINKEFITAELMPEPEGGAAGWSKFLNKNLRYPYQAQEEGKSGRVIVSFVVERDGHLTDITVTGKAGYGMDEEAIRVLKLSKNWRPGKQNGNAVRVRYSIPINFVLTE
ncbi:energy transducer TonB [Mucilaginibacter conchicola]|uniref:Energy transducer TonB n=1 Tax=Mucilaginibacter conchicola TaxID=2303333 RepID=A0A372NWQ6_9SPHI|nr:energy transducer TonB [Mucilaginibacter conchicola]RFZ94543.1 energy transducer TonB [Mucilaginibacter conchicola]